MRKRIWRKHDERSRYEISLNWLNGWTRIHPYVRRWKRGLTRVSSSSSSSSLSSSVSRNFQFLDNGRPSNAFKFSSTKLEVSLSEYYKGSYYLSFYLFSKRSISTNYDADEKKLSEDYFPRWNITTVLFIFSLDLNGIFSFKEFEGTSNDSSDKNSKIIIDEKRN